MTKTTVIRSLTFAAMLGAASPGAAALGNATKDQLLAAYNDNTLYLETFSYEFASYYDADGTARGRGWNLIGEERGSATWHVTDAGLFCVQWHNDWAGGNENCYTVQLSGKESIFTHVSGEGGKSRTFVILAGNPYSL